MNTYKGTKYRIMRSSFGTINQVIVLSAGKSYQFDTIKQAKRFINILAS